MASLVPRAFTESLMPDKQLSHDRAPKRVTELMNKVRRAVRKAKRNGTWKERTGELVKHFFKLVDKQSSPKKKSRRATNASLQRGPGICHQNVWRFSSDILDKNNERRVDQDATNYCNSIPVPSKVVHQACLDTFPKSPKQEFEINDIRQCEIVTVVRASRSKLSPSLIWFHM